MVRFTQLVHQTHIAYRPRYRRLVISLAWRRTVQCPSKDDLDSIHWVWHSLYGICTRTWARMYSIVLYFYRAAWNADAV